MHKFSSWSVSFLKENLSPFCTDTATGKSRPIPSWGLDALSQYTHFFLGVIKIQYPIKIKGGIFKKARVLLSEVI